MWFSLNAADTRSAWSRLQTRELMGEASIITRSTTRRTWVFR